ncbi:site-specific integrase [Burkholderia dolosa]|uniref:Site-specific integrase n=1 Tax=Burkholderia dolosa TaxID=152500 RepID=A0A892IC74_9BURK|nr:MULTISPECIES: site-specific integrase [Burkholderia]AKE02351.1 integrase [Burkholderia cepacia]AJY12204.1 phage integrase family protein [Burkholderia dolosa AU0158]AYZ97099.1 site-specific integrase [Burkholderia dolosa]ETP64135.1 DNA recombinase [Burkholderia dolosa PC543]MBR8420621.1 site-specific integrase [Burkholderia dolosa]
MAYISQRGEYWRAEVRRRGYKPVYRTFDTKQQAQKWARHVEGEMDTGSFVDRSAAERTTLAEALKRYRKEIVPEKRHPYQEERRIDRWLANDLAHRTLANLKGADFAKYRDERRAAGRAENTIRLELQVIRHLFEIARKEWNMEGLPNPLDNIRKPSGSKARDRRLRPGEFDKLKTLLSASRNPWAAPAFELAIETSLRQGALFGLRWEWIDLKNRVIRFPVEARGADNKGVPAVLPLSRRANNVLRNIAAVAEGAEVRVARAMYGPPDVRHDLSGPVFTTSVNAVICVWKRTLHTAGKSDPELLTLRWHDLRHEAASRLFEKGLNPMEVASITGHRSMQMLKRYTHLKPESLLEKLG